MKKFASFLLVLILFFQPTFALADNRDLIVYYAVGSKSAYCYHARSSCGALSRSTVGEITLERAVSRGLSPCSKCNPPSADFVLSETPRPTPRPTFRPTPSPTPSYALSLTQMPVPSKISSKSTYTVKTAKKPDVVGGVLSTAFVVTTAILIIVWLKNDKKQEKERIRLQKEKDEHDRSKKKPRETINTPDRPNYYQIALERQRTAEQDYLKRLEERRLREALALEKAAELKKQKEERDCRRREERAAKKREYTELYGGKTSLECSGAPQGVCFGKDGLPRQQDADAYWGPDYTFFKTPSGKTYHTAHCRYAQRSDIIPINAYELRKYPLWPCTYCNPISPDMGWIKRYNKIREIRAKYDIPEPDNDSSL